jgi:hypothetical protein
MAFGPNPISAEAARKALVENDRLDANHNETSSSRAALDAEELQDLERSLYYTGASHPVDSTTSNPDPIPAPAPMSRRGLIARLFRRG